MPDYDDSLTYLDSFVDYEKRPPDAPPPRSMGLERVAMLLEALGGPHRKLRCLHIAGTKGKGSTAAMAASILRAAGYRTGLYTSPHLIDVRERISIDGAPIPRASFAGLLERTRPHLERIRRQIQELPPGAVLRRPTYFEIMTHLAFLHFEQEKVDVGVLEVGMGGRLDATNVVERPMACAITNVSLDHTAILGRTLGAIAREKAGILKAGVPAVVAPQRPAAARAIRSAARRAKSPLWWVGKEIVLENPDSREFSVRTPHALYRGLSIPMLGAHQLQNAAVAVGLVENARLRGLERLTEEAVREGLSRVRWPGRIQMVAQRPLTILDGAHNPESIGALVATLERHMPGRKADVVFAVAQDKDWKTMLRRLAPHASSLTVTTSGSPRAVPIEQLGPAASRAGFGEVRAEGDPVKAMERARSSAGVDGLVVATGSLYLVGKLLPLFPDAGANTDS